MLKVGKSKLIEEGPLLITHWGLSGPLVLKLSAWAARDLHEVKYQSSCQVNWCPDLSVEQLRQTILLAKQELSRRKIISSNPLSLPLRLWQYWTTHTHIPTDKRWADISKTEVNQLLQLISQGQFKIQGKGVFKEEFVTCGGIPLKEVNFKTMESQCCPGLFFAGEVLDVDGVTGGFNFQNAWTTGWLAGQALGEPL